MNVLREIATEETPDGIIAGFSLFAILDKNNRFSDAYNILKQANEKSTKLYKHNFAVHRKIFTMCSVERTFDEVRSSLSFKPIFIVGLPRSGTTLLENKLNDYERVFGAGELAFLAQALNKYQVWDKKHIDRSTIELIREYYSARVEKLSKSSMFVVDKMPANFRYIHFINSVFPEAKIIHMTRDHRAIAWSLYSKNLEGIGNNYSYDFQNIYEYQGLYKKLIERFRSLNCEFLDVQYETFTENLNAELDKICDYLNIDTDRVCSQTKANFTASLAQVKGAVYTGSSERWRLYKEFLAPAHEMFK